MGRLSLVANRSDSYKGCTRHPTVSVPSGKLKHCTKNPPEVTLHENRTKEGRDPDKTPDSPEGV